jgi:hypothetical protein
MFGFKMKLRLGNKVLLPEYGQKKVLIERSCQAWNETLSENEGVDGIQQFTNKSSLGQLGFKTNTKFKTQLN